MNTNEIRNLFLNYFKTQGHTIMPSASLVPADDPSLLFTSAGMVQFKKIFLGQEVVPYKRATSCQRCLRAGGKHNDLENVGFTSRHHTFFEMLGNFSFGDYFKREAIVYAWEFITKQLKIPTEKLWITVYKDDLEAEEIWLKEIKIDPARFSRCDENENFWAMGDTGPCGPCTEIYYDHGAQFVGDPPGLGDTGERYVEIYNLVFMQYNRNLDGELHLLPKPCVDTGMGLERVAAIMQGEHNNYNIDIFRNLIKKIAVVLKVVDLQQASLKVIADHLRACSFLVVDGIVPSNEGRGYVLRRIMRRAIRHGYKLGSKEPFFYLLVKYLVEIMGQDFPELSANAKKIEQVFLTEELQFAKTLEHGMKLLQQAMQETQVTKKSIVAGETVFKLYDTYGFPVDLTMDIVREHAMSLDMEQFDKCMLEQKNRARQLMKFKDFDLELDGVCASEFVGYDQEEFSANIVQMFPDDSNQSIVQLSADQAAKIVLTATPFYAQSGGQVGDTGVLVTAQGAKFIVHDTQKLGTVIVHIGELVTGKLTVNELVIAKIDNNRRQKIKLNHSATHLLQAALRLVLGLHVKQKGSIVDEQKLRFDFEHPQALTAEQIEEVELLVNEKIRANKPTITEVTSVQDAVSKGAIALFDEKYRDNVRLLNIADGFSLELCGGTHVKASGDIGCFKIVSEEAIASGVRRVEAMTGEHAIRYITGNQRTINALLKLLKVPHQQSIEVQINKILQKSKDLEKSLELAQKQNALMQVDALLPTAKVIGTEIKVKVLVTCVNMDPKHFKSVIDHLKQLLGTGVIILGCVHNAKAFLIVGVSKDLVNIISAVDLVQNMAVVIEGKGGGRKDLSEASGSNVANLAKALELGSNKIMECINK